MHVIVHGGNRPSPNRCAPSSAASRGFRRTHASDSCSAETIAAGSSRRPVANARLVNQSERWLNRPSVSMTVRTGTRRSTSVRYGYEPTQASTSPFRNSSAALP